MVILRHFQAYNTQNSVENHHNQAFFVIEVMQMAMSACSV